MLVFFIHGVATKDAAYSKKLQELLKEQFTKRNQSPPNFYAGFWGAVFKQTGQVWNWIHQDLQSFKRVHLQVDIGDIFRYQEFREDFISQFFGDVLTYFNTDRGYDIRDNIADQLYKFLKHHSQENKLHVITHSLGSVILWDILFSDRLANDDPAHTIRSLLFSSSCCLKSITTMGSPILFFNMMLDISSAKVGDLAKHQAEPLRWLNIIHASDIIAYPLAASINAQSIPNLLFWDKYIWADANGAEKVARTLGQAHTAMALAVSDAHGSYWQSRGTARLIADNILGDRGSIDSATIDIE